MVKSQIMCRNGYELTGHTAPWLNRDIMMLPVSYVLLRCHSLHRELAKQRPRLTRALDYAHN